MALGPVVARRREDEIICRETRYDLKTILKRMIELCPELDRARLKRVVAVECPYYLFPADVLNPRLSISDANAFVRRRYLKLDVDRHPGCDQSLAIAGCRTG